MEKYAIDFVLKNRHKHITKATKIHQVKTTIWKQNTFLKQKIKCYSIFSWILSHTHTPTIGVW